MPEGEYIKLALKNGAGVDYFTPNQDLLNILLSEKWSLCVNQRSGRLRVEYWKRPWSDDSRSSVYMYDLALSCYYGMVHEKTLDSDLQRYFSWKNGQGLELDHLDGNVHNNTILNLSLMSHCSNSGKKLFPAGFISPYTLAMAYVDGEYRTQLAMENTSLSNIQQQLDHAFPGIFCLNDKAGISALHFICKDAENLVACLKYLHGARFDWCNLGETAKTHKKKRKDIEHMAADIKKSLAAQRTLAMMDRTQFQIFTSDELRA